MSAVDAVADDFETWEGVCGKDGQGAPVGSGSPTLRISQDHGRRHRCLTSASSCAAAVEAATTASRSRRTPRSHARPRSSALRGEVEGMTFAESRGRRRPGDRATAGSATRGRPTPRADEVRAGGRARAGERGARRARRVQRAAGRRRASTPMPELFRAARPTSRPTDKVRAGARPGAPRGLARPARDEGRSGAGRRRGLARRDRLDDRRGGRVRAHRRVVRRGDARRRGRRDPDRLLVPRSRGSSTSSAGSRSPTRPSSARSGCWAP